MKRKDVRSLLLSMVIGDGCLHYIKSNGKNYGGFTMDHGIAQSDYLTWKAQIVSKIMNRNVNIRNGHQGKSVQIQVCDSRFKAWRKFCYPGNKKQISKILRFINHPEFAIAVWLMDDGYVEPSFSKLTDGTKKLYSARFRIFTCSESIEQQDMLIDWFKKTFDVTPAIKMQKNSKTRKEYPFLKFSQADSLKIWEKIRDVVLGINSMKIKFRHIEYIYQLKSQQRTPHNVG